MDKQAIPKLFKFQQKFKSWKEELSCYGLEQVCKFTFLQVSLFDLIEIVIGFNILVIIMLNVLLIIGNVNGKHQELFTNTKIQTKTEANTKKITKLVGLK